MSVYKTITVKTSINGEINTKSSLISDNIDGNSDTSSYKKIQTNSDLTDNISVKAKLSKNLKIGADITTPSSGTNDYNKLINKPIINDVTVIGNKSLQDYDIQETISYATNTDIDRLF